MKPGAVLLFSVLLTVNSAQRYEELQSKYTEEMNKVGILTEKLDSVTQSLKRYEKIDRALHDLCAHLSGGDNAEVKSGQEDADTHHEETDSVLENTQLSGGDKAEVKSGQEDADTHHEETDSVLENTQLSGGDNAEMKSGQEDADTHHEETDSVLENTQLSGGDNGGGNKNPLSFRFEEDLQVTFIEAEPDQDGLFFFVQYSAPAKAVVRAEDGFDGALDNVENRFASGHGNISVHSDANLMLTLFLPNREQMLTRMYAIVNSVNESGHVDVPPFSLTALPSEEAVFENGSSVNVTLRYGYEEAYLVAGQYTFYTVNSTAPNTIKAYVARSKPTSVIVAERHTMGNSNRSDIIITINSDSNNCEGILHVRLELQPIIASSFELYLIKDIEIPVRMADHTVPFPDGFLGFYAEGFSNAFQSDGLACLDHGSCTGLMVLVGNDPENVTIRRKGEGQKTAANHVSVKNQKSMYTVRVVFHLVRASLADRGMYVLQGTSRSGTVIEKDLLIEVRGRFFVSKKHSGVKNSTAETLVVGCTVQGYPPPEIGFYDRPLGDEERQRFVEGQGVSIEGYKSIDTSYSELTISGPHEEVKNIYCQPETDVYSEDVLIYDADVDMEH